MDTTPSRRDFLAASGSVLGGAWLALHLPAVEAAAAHARTAAARGLPLEVLTEAEARSFGAAADRILPPGDGFPGARAVGAARFADRIFSDFARPYLDGLRGLISALDAAAVERGVAAFDELDAARQDAVIGALESGQPQLFGLLRLVTVAGVLSEPHRGGNRDRAGWALLGFEAAPAYQPPFGYYDRPVHDGGGDR